MMYLISYDISNKKRLRAMHTLLSQHALRVQYSVFMAQLNQAQKTALEQEILATINAQADKCLVTALHPNQIQWLGQPPVSDGVILSLPCLYLE